MPVYCILSIHQYTLFLDMLIWWIFWDRRYNRDTVFCLFARRSRVPGFGLTPIALSRPRDFRILDLATETCGTPFSGHTTLFRWMFESTGITAYNFAVSHGARGVNPHSLLMIRLIYPYMLFVFRGLWYFVQPKLYCWYLLVSHTCWCIS